MRMPAPGASFAFLAKLLQRRREGGREGEEGGREGGRGENKGRVNSGMKREQSILSHSTTHPHQSTNSTDLNV